MSGGEGGDERSHSRSASWSFTQQRGRGGLAALNPLTSVFRDIVAPSFTHRTDSSQNLRSGDDTRTGNSTGRSVSQVSLNLGNGFDDGLRDDVPLLAESGWAEGRGVANRGPFVREGDEHQQGGVADQDAGDAGVEISDGFRWLEQNAIFILLLLAKFAWYHRSGQSSV